MSSDYFNNLDEESKTRYKEKLTWGSVVFPDPYDEKEASNFVDDIQQWPAIRMPQLVAYLLETPGPYTLQSLKAFQSLNAYRFYESGHIREIRVHKHKSGLCMLVGRVLPSQRKVNDAGAYKCWIVAEASGEVKSAHCTCKAGLGEVCSHIAAILFAIDHMVSSGQTQVSCTSRPCSWAKIEKEVENLPLHEVQFTKRPVYKRNREEQGRESMTKHVAKTADSSKKSSTTFIDKLRELNPSSRLFSMAASSISNEETETASEMEDEAAVRTMLPPPLTALFKVHYQNLEDNDLNIVIGSILDSLLCADTTDLEKLEECTRNQSSSEIWVSQRIGRITASSFDRILTRKEAASPINLVSTLMNYMPNSLDHIPSFQWGRAKETKARQIFIQKEKPKHINMKCRRAGLHLMPDHPYLGASPDGIVECDCCGKSLLELKCPIKFAKTTIEEACRDESFYLNPDRTLKKKHSYYTQVQGQLGVTGYKKSFFVVWTEKDISVTVIDFDEEFWQMLLEKLKAFFSTHLLRELCTRRYDPRLNSNESERFYCFCQKSNFDKMIACNNEACKYLWFHRACVGITRLPQTKWFCSECKFKLSK